ncbi:MAG TPA: hypothetical protein EYH23_00350 [Euryarchaeota archaeon]|nr:hypothetical protein [Euryarchaeota archaeon]
MGTTKHTRDGVMTAKIKLTPLSAPRELESSIIVVRDVKDTEKLYGCIAAAEYIPRNWAPVIFGKCVGAVIWAGGYLSHFAILAREFNFPVFRSDREIPEGRHYAKIKEEDGEWWMYV